ncbi:MAG: NlpC/P60 family protein [Prosthecobacter sp.]|uniref:NlpC/P60 family protein n=1 Tax=Prosthecobacter sp. TaxID=1965333 RepID=UPI0038FDFEC7
MNASPRISMILFCMISIAHAEATKKSEPAQDEQAKTPPPAAVSSVSIEDISGFDKYPKQVQSLVQSALALTHLELGYLYGSHEPNKGGMDCSGTVYHVLQFQGLKGVPRQSDEMCQWVEKKTQLHLTPTATGFDSEEFANLKPGDLLFWTNTTETKRKLPVTHVMIYLGKLKQNGKRVVFGASDGRSFAGLRRSGVSVFDFHLPKAESPTRFYGYGPAPGLLPVAVEPTPAVIAATTKPVEKTVPAEKPTPPPAEKPAASKEEVRKAVALVSEAKPEPKAEPKQTVVTETKPKATPTTKTKSSNGTVKKSTTTPVKKKTPPPPQKSQMEKTLDRAVDSMRRFFR